MPGSGFNGTNRGDREEVELREVFFESGSSSSPGGGACPFTPCAGPQCSLQAALPPAQGAGGGSHLSCSSKPWLPWERRRGPLWSVTHAPGTRPMDIKLRNAANQSAGSPDGLPRLLPPIRTKIDILMASVERDFIIIFSKGSLQIRRNWSKASLPAAAQVVFALILY